jgi:heat shock protein HslJ
VRRSGSSTQFARSARCAATVALFIAALAHAAAPALEGRWTLVDRTALGGAKGDRGPDITLEIQGDSLSASAGCNRAAGSIKEQGGRLEIGPLASTMMACPPAVAKVEARFFGVLERRPSYVLKGDLLTLSGAGDTLTFKRVPSR